MKKQTAAIFTAAAVTAAALSAFASGFPDVPQSHWAYDYINSMSEEGVLKGYEDGTFRPDNTVTRAEWATMLAEKAGLKSDGTSTFSDMSGHWAEESANAVKDYFKSDESLFNPTEGATRTDVAVSLAKIKGHSGGDGEYTTTYITFSDVDSIPAEDRTYVALAVANGFVSGYEDNTFRGENTLTRAEAATLLARAFKEVSGEVFEGTEPTPEPTAAPAEASATPTPTDSCPIDCSDVASDEVNGFKITDWAFTSDGNYEILCTFRTLKEGKGSVQATFDCLDESGNVIYSFGDVYSCTDYTWTEHEELVTVPKKTVKITLRK